MGEELRSTKHDIEFDCDGTEEPKDLRAAEPQPIVVHCKCNKKQEKEARFKCILRIPFILIAVALTLYVCQISTKRYWNVWVQTSIDSTNMHISEIPFPAVTICPMKLVKLSELSSNTTTTKVTDPEQFEKLLLIARHIIRSEPDTDDLQPHNFSAYSNYDDILLNELFGFFNYTCEDLFHSCLWRKQQVSCCKLFGKLTTVEGNCFSFNSIYTMNNEHSWPLSVARAGPLSGLKVKLNRNVKGNLVEQIVVGIHDFKAYVGTNVFRTAADRFVVPVEPLKFTADLDVAGVPIEMRHCRFQDELDLQYQLESDCILKCHLAHILRKCNCTYFYDIPMPTSADYQWHPYREMDHEESINKPKRNCQAKDLPCFHKYRHAFFSMGNVIDDTTDDGNLLTHDCECYPDCNRVLYRTASYMENNAESLRQTDVLELQVYFQQDSLFSYRSMLRFTFLDLMVSFGGIAGLFLGFSMISIFDALLECVTRWKHRCTKLKRKIQNKGAPTITTTTTTTIMTTD